MMIYLVVQVYYKIRLRNLWREQEHLSIKVKKWGQLPSSNCGHKETRSKESMRISIRWKVSSNLPVLISFCIVTIRKLLSILYLFNLCGFVGHIERAEKLVLDYTKRMASDKIIQAFAVVNGCIMVVLIAYVLITGKTLSKSNGNSIIGVVFGANTYRPTAIPTHAPINGSSFPSVTPSFRPSIIPTFQPTDIPSIQPTDSPTCQPTVIPTTLPTIDSSFTPSLIPSAFPSFCPSSSPTYLPSITPSSSPSETPSNKPSSNPSQNPSINPSPSPSSTPSHGPTVNPSPEPSESPTNKPSSSPSIIPSNVPTASPSAEVTDQPSSAPT